MSDIVLKQGRKTLAKIETPDDPALQQDFIAAVTALSSQYQGRGADADNARQIIEKIEEYVSVEKGREGNSPFDRGLNRVAMDAIELAFHAIQDDIRADMHRIAKAAAEMCEAAGYMPRKDVMCRTPEIS